MCAVKCSIILHSGISTEFSYNTKKRLCFTQDINMCKHIFMSLENGSWPPLTHVGLNLTPFEAALSASFLFIHLFHSIQASNNLDINRKSYSVLNSLATNDFDLSNMRMWTHYFVKTSLISSQHFLYYIQLFLPSGVAEQGWMHIQNRHNLLNSKSNTFINKTCRLCLN